MRRAGEDRREPRALGPQVELVEHQLVGLVGEQLAEIDPGDRIGRIERRARLDAAIDEDRSEPGGDRALG